MGPAERTGHQLPPLDRRINQDGASAARSGVEAGVEERSRQQSSLPHLPSMSKGAPRTPPNKRSSPILGFDSGQPRIVKTAAGKTSRGSSPKKIQIPPSHGPPNFRIGMLEADYEGEIINALDVVDYYATYGHTANIQLFHLVADEPSGHPYDLRVREVPFLLLKSVQYPARYLQDSTPHGHHYRLFHSR